MTGSRRELERLASIITERTGLTFPTARQRDMEEALIRALSASQADSEQLESLLETDTGARDELIANLTVGESYFFRDAAQFAFLRDELLPSLASSRGTGPLRIWSAGCAAGEEAYSLAILSAEAGLADRVTIVATDISRTRLAAARRGVYTRWALRGLDSETIDRYFLQSGKRYVLRPEYCGLVDFRYLNLAEDRYPSLTTGIWGFDVILCRNVLIYFDRPTVARVAKRLVDSLSEDGWLLLGASDPGISELAHCDVVMTSAGLAYRRAEQRADTLSVDTTRPDSAERWPGEVPEPEPHRSAGSGRADLSPAEAGAGREEGEGRDQSLAHSVHPAGAAEESGPGRQPLSTADRRQHSRSDVENDIGRASLNELRERRGPTPAAAAVEDILAPVREAYRRRDYGKAVQLAEDRLPAHPLAELHILRVRALANLGELDRAGAAIDQALEQFRDSAELLYLHSILLAEAGKWRDAVAAARRALYLDRTLVVGHIALAQALRRTGDSRGARRALRNAADLLDHLPPDTIVPGSDGENVARLRTNVRAQLRLLEDVA